MRHGILIGTTLLCLSACGDPAREVPRLDDVTVSEDAPVASALSDPAEDVTEGGGLLARIFGGEPSSDRIQEADAPAATDESVESAQPEETEGLNTPAGSERRGLFGLFRGQAGGRGAKDPSPVDGPGTDAASVDQDDDNGTAQETQAAATRPRGLAALFGRNTGEADPSRGPDAQEVGPDTRLPYGVVARQCSLSRREMGREIDRYPERGAGYRLYDSDPGNTAPHTFYITGFSDGCARQVTAALAVFGSPSMHEKIRYGLPADLHPYSTTDKAYETLKSRICGVSRNAPCGARIGTIERNTVFLSLYERFEDNARWADMLLHDGHVLAKDVKTP